MAVTSHTNRFKRRLLQGAVDENLDTINGRPLGTLRRQRHRRTTKVRRFLLTAAALVVAGAALAALISGGGTPPAGDAGRPDPTAEHTAARMQVAARPPHVGDIVERLEVSKPEPLVPAVIPVEVGRVAIDPGHGGVDGGTSMGYGLLEKNLTKDIANRLSQLLTAGSWGVVLTRDGDDAVPLKQRAEIANAARADLFLSIHVNWLPDRTARGFETYYLGPTDDPFLRRLAAIENRDSGFALADYRDLLQGIYADVRHDQSSQLAKNIQDRLFDTLRQDNPEIASRGVMSAPFAVLVATEMPAVLVEVACLSNDREARLLAVPGYRQRIAEALFAGITDYAARVKASTIESEKGS